jgi:hypothetical protein
MPKATTKTDAPAREVYTYTAKSGVTIDLTPFHLIPSGIFRRARHLNGMEQVFAVIEAGADEANLDKVDALPVGETNTLFDLWSDGATPGN